MNNGSAEAQGQTADNAEQESAAPREPIGATLRRTREAAGVPVEAIADRLNCLPAHIESLETERFDYFKGSTYVIGYLRAYCKQLDLNPEPLIESYRATLPPEEPVTPIAPRQSVSLFDNAPVKSHWGTAAVLAIVLGLWWVSTGEMGTDSTVVVEDSIDANINPLALIEPEAQPEIDGSGEPPQAEVSELAADAVVETVEELEPSPGADRLSSPAVGNDLAGSEPRQSAPGAGVESVTRPAPTATNALPADAGGDYTVAGADDHLHMRFGADCWVEIKDRNGELMIAVLKHQGDTLDVTGEGPFKVLVGFAPAVEEMLFNGEAVAIDRVAGNQSARLSVGDES